MLDDVEIKRVIRNSGYMLITQGITYISPLLILGFLIKNLGIDGFGKYAVCLAVAAYIQVIIDYGFSFTSSRAISQNRDNKNLVSNVFWMTISIKILLAVVIFPFYYFIVSYLVNDNVLKEALIIAYLLVLGNSFLPIWYYQGKENLKPIAFLNLISRAFSCALVLLFVKNKSDINIALICQSVPSLVCALIAILIPVYKQEVQNTIPKISFVKEELAAGWSMFTATLYSVILSNSAVFLLGIMTNPVIVGAYATIERVIKAFTSLFAPLTQSVYPYNCNKFKESISSGLNSVNKTAKPIMVLAVLGSLFVIIAMLFYHFYWVENKIEGFLQIATLLTLWMFFSVLNNILGIQTLSAAGHSRSYSNSFKCVAIFTLILMIVLINYWQNVGAAVSMFIGELSLTILLISKVYKLVSLHKVE